MANPELGVYISDIYSSLAPPCLPQPKPQPLPLTSFPLPSPYQYNLFPAPMNNPIIHPTPAQKTALLAPAIPVLVLLIYSTLYTALETTYAILKPFR